MTTATARLAQRIARALGYDLVPLRKSRAPMRRLVRALHWFTVDAVVDVGANTGQYGQMLRAAGWAGPILSIEPVPEAHARLAKIASRDAAWQVLPPMALGAEHGTADLAISAESDMTSLLPRTTLLDRLSPSSLPTRTIEVEVHRLDALGDELDTARQRLFVKLDVQGYERQVLAGATGLWPRIVGLQLELSLVELYAGETHWRSMIDHLGTLGYIPWLFLPGYVEPKLTRELQMDGVFFRASDAEGLTSARLGAAMGKEA